jgi:phosphoglucosamine mutase
MEEYAMAKYFGTDGFRGEANIGLTVEHAFKIGRYLGWYYGRDHKAKAVIGKDTRRSSYMFEYALCAGLTASGADAYMMHVTTTPSVSYIARADDFDCGIMISASHNPYYDNGIKLLNADGEKMEESVLDGIEEYIDSESELPYAQREAIGRTIDYSAGRNRYIGYLISLATRSYKGRRIGLDCANGSTWQMAKSIFDALGADTYVIANSPDGLNINVDCGSTHIGNLRKFVLENRLDAGFAFDGDADRCLAVDEKGNVVTGDHILYVCAKYMKDRGVFGDSKVVTTVMSNMGLYKALDEIGIGYEKTAVGDKYVAENMRANGYLIGGEQSGHIIFGRLANTGDGLLTAIKLMEAMTETKQPLSVLASPVTIYPQLLKNVVVTDKDETMGVRRGEKRGGEGRAGTGRQRQGASAQKRHRARPAGHGGGLQRRAVRKIRGLYHRRHARRRQTCEGEMTCTEQKTCWI